MGPFIEFNTLFAMSVTHMYLTLRSSTLALSDIVLHMQFGGRSRQSQMSEANDTFLVRFETFAYCELKISWVTISAQRIQRCLQNNRNICCIFFE